MLDDVAAELAGQSIAIRRAKPSGGSTPTVADGVDVALDEVAAERLAGAQRRLEVDPAAGLEPPRVVSERVWFITSAAKPPPPTSVDGKAGAGDGDRVALRQRGGEPGGHPQADASVGPPRCASTDPISLTSPVNITTPSSAPG